MNSLLEIYLLTKLVGILTTDWTKLPAYKLGIIDDNGKFLKKSSKLKTNEEKNAFTLFHRFAFNLKRLIETLPGGKSRLAKYLTVYALLKEELSIDDTFAEFVTMDTVFEEYINTNETVLRKGRYFLEHDSFDEQGNPVRKGEAVYSDLDIRPRATVFGTDVFEVTHEKTKGKLLVAYEDVSADPRTGQ